ncbi:MAG: hypothetical protein L3K06_07660 [Thermoplasmata archaeon]|nr:hypothetical protein [Thermoplasmata archaeon]
MTVTMKFGGGWGDAKEALERWRKLPEVLDQATALEAQYARKQVVEGIKAQAPGGKPFAQLSRMTLMLRRAQGFKGKKALIRTGTLLRNVTVKKVAPGKHFLGVIRGARSAGGEDLVNVAEVQENGRTFVMRLTPKARRFFFAMLRQAEGPDGDVEIPGVSGGGGFSVGHAGRAVLIVKIPARPFIGPVIDKIRSDPAALRDRMARRVAMLLKLSQGNARKVT